MTRLIDADKLMEELDNIVYTRKASDRHLLQIISAIQNAPTVDAVEVVRCKDCKQWSDYAPITTEHIKYCEYGKYMTGELGYCFYGERKEK